MHELFKQLIASQYKASFCTLAHATKLCPDSLWNAPVAKYPFSQVVFHTLMFADVYLGEDEESVREQPFHRDNLDLFADYEQLLDQEPVSLYSRAQIELYAQFCREKASRVMREETEVSLRAPCRFPPKKFSRAELHVYNIRHIQHHAAQLIVRLRRESNVNIPWIGSGWRDVAGGPQHEL